MLVTTSENIPGKNILSTIGYVKGSSARARHAVADIFASFKNVLGGEIEEYSRLLQQTRDQAVERMIADAEKQGGNAIICFRIESSTIAQGASEVVAYGTAVVIEE
ncbi:MAG: YbjQ family protein [Gammaproteobacteria bacterium TMED112]|nr:MAG: YbjQ family protein [Gammaproteobacteria bacterium TMED112]|tara:strand:- start:7865 stop:8182 length:318 start_codon:yes stop_codon:yes gene_type:complete